MKVLKDIYSFVFGKSKPNKKRKLTPPSERPKNAYLKYVEHGLINEGILIGQYTGEWVKDQKAWYKYFKANKDFVMINIKNKETNTHSEPKPKMTIKPGKPLVTFATASEMSTTGKYNTDGFEDQNKKLRDAEV